MEVWSTLETITAAKAKNTQLAYYVAISGTLYLRLRVTKSGEEQDQPIPTWAAIYISNIVSRRNTEGAKDEDYLFVRYRGKRREPLGSTVPPRTIARWLDRWSTEIGAPCGGATHTGRTTAITKLLADGETLEAVQKFARHSDPRVTEGYDRRRLGVEENCGLNLKY